ncbi:hypothetical protein C8R46DRAFT_287723 [Mycena filopes]|nr:hypothetical protein C8R46DRAFT_287723 [Mycena filopes]
MSAGRCAGRKARRVERVTTQPPRCRRRRCAGRGRLLCVTFVRRVMFLLAMSMRAVAKKRRTAGMKRMRTPNMSANDDEDTRAGGASSRSPPNSPSPSSPSSSPSASPPASPSCDERKIGNESRPTADITRCAPRARPSAPLPHLRPHPRPHSHPHPHPYLLPRRRPTEEDVGVGGTCLEGLVVTSV